MFTMGLSWVMQMQWLLFGMTLYAYRISNASRDDCPANARGESATPLRRA